MLQLYNIKIVYRARFFNIDANNLNYKLCPSQINSIGAQWYFEEDEEEVAEWHVLALLSNLAATKDSTVGYDIVEVEDNFSEE